MLIDTEFDFRNDSKCGDPDKDSIKLYEVQKFLWSKELPNGKFFWIEIKKKNSSLLLGNKFCMNLSSDRMHPCFTGYDKKNKFDDWLSEKEVEIFMAKTRTIGGHIPFPAHKKNGFTVNQARGINRKIRDRFDLTLECIRRFYLKEESPLYSVLCEYHDFFELFVDFKGYTDFFLLQDLVDDSGEVRFLLPFSSFEESPLPENEKEFRDYVDAVLLQIRKRNDRILEYERMITN